MNRITRLFKEKNKRVLNIYCTAGFPKLDSTLEVMQALQKNGADIIELGMPYSDPLADGPVIQESNAKAIANGMTIKKLFSDLQHFRDEIHVPVVLMGYMNPVLQYGFEEFCKDAHACGIDGLIIPDLPQYEYEIFYAAILKKYDLHFIFLITPETSEPRIKRLDELSGGFIYAVSSSATTGSKQNDEAVSDYLDRLQKLQLNNPVLVGFGIKDKGSFDRACRYANGAIIGTAYIQALHENKSVEETTRSFITSIINNS
jgi:tryptophan synthase alpha chain